MARMTVTVEDAGLRDVLRGLSGRAANLRPAMDDIGSMLMTAADMRFEKQVDPDGQPWTPLAAATVARKAKLGREQILQMSGLLRVSITREVGATSVTIGSNRPYSAIHQFGGRINRAAHLTAIFRRVVQRGGAWQFATQDVTTPAGHVVQLHRFASKKEAFGKQGRGRGVLETHHAVGAYAITIPARPYLGINAGDQQAATEILRRFVMGAS